MAKSKYFDYGANLSPKDPRGPALSMTLADELIEFEPGSFSFQWWPQLEYRLKSRSRAEVLERAKKGIWRNGKGVDIELSKLEDSHLFNIIRMVEDKRAPFDTDLAPQILSLLMEEVTRREVTLNQKPEGPKDRFELIELE